MIFNNRREAGKQLANDLYEYQNEDAIILALPRGGVPLGFEVASVLKAPLDVIISRKIGAPKNPEFGIGAISEKGVMVWDERIVNYLEVTAEEKEDLKQAEQVELERRLNKYRSGKELADLKGKTVILVDDGLATGVTAKAAIKSLKKLKPAKIVFAAPVCAHDTVNQLVDEIEKVVCTYIPPRLRAIGLYYRRFDQTTDEQVVKLLKQAKVELEGRVAKEKRDSKPTTPKKSPRILPLRNSASLDPLIEQAADKQLMLLGEASHGTKEYYQWRSKISQRLIKEQGYQFIGVEGDWPDCYRLNRYVKGYDTKHKSAQGILSEFERWPTWMWANWEIVELAKWLKQYNQDLPDDQKVGFYGLDVYSLWESLEEIIRYLKRTNSEALEQAYQAFECFEPFNKDVRSYARSSALVPESCQEEVIQLLTKIRSKQQLFQDSSEAEFSAKQNAFVLKNAEDYYRNMVTGRVNTWNLRDRHMMDTLKRLLKFHQDKNDKQKAKGIVWAHNTHVGDARFTSMREADEFNIGQLSREEYGLDQVRLVGFSTYQGTVIAGRYWDAQMRAMRLPPAKNGSWGELMHKLKPANKLIVTRNLSDQIKDLETANLKSEFDQTKGQRAVGVVYHPEAERGNYVPTNLAKRYDYVLHLEQTHALSPLHLSEDESQLPETYPFGY